MRGKRGRPKARSPDPNRRSRVSPHVRSSSSNSPGTALGMFSRLLLLTFKEDRTAERCASRASSHCTPPLPLLSLCAPCMQSAERRHSATLSRPLRCIKQGAKCYIKQGAKWSGHRDHIGCTGTPRFCATPPCVRVPGRLRHVSTRSP